MGLAVTITVPGGLLLPELGSAASNPPGNNGTIKIDQQPFDDAPNNEPHVGCTFQVDFYGFDQGDLYADVAFEAQPPTLRPGGGSQVLLTDRVFIGEDDNAGGGSQAGLDASQTYTLDLTGITPHPLQGYHVKLTIHAEGAQGADTKHKVFWVTGCGPTTTSGPTTSSSGRTSSAPSTTVTGATTTSGAGPSSSGSSAGGSASSAASSSVAGGVSSSQAGGSGLPFTGASLLPVLLVGLALLGLGAALLRNGYGHNRT
jgi:hypothetical protein